LSSATASRRRPCGGQGVLGAHRLHDTSGGALPRHAPALAAQGEVV
jgi:hypothetical protein